MYFTLCIEYIGEFMALNQKDPILFWGIFFYKLSPQLIKFNIPTNDWISFPALGGTGVYISGILNPIINSVKFWFWVSIVCREKKRQMREHSCKTRSFDRVVFRRKIVNYLNLLIYFCFFFNLFLQDQYDQWFVSTVKHTTADGDMYVYF